jgi:hypothetical protein
LSPGLDTSIYQITKTTPETGSFFLSGEGREERGESGFGAWLQILVTASRRVGPFDARRCRLLRAGPFRYRVLAAAVGILLAQGPFYALRASKGRRYVSRSVGQ